MVTVQLFTTFRIVLWAIIEKEAQQVGHHHPVLNSYWDQFRKAEMLWTCNFCYMQIILNCHITVGAETIAKFALTCQKKSKNYYIYYFYTTIFKLFHIKNSQALWVCIILRRSMRSLNWASLKCWEKVISTCSFCWEVTTLQLCTLASVFHHGTAQNTLALSEKTWI